jgi:CCR4-NOT transcriptional complex subunit CAF120
MEGWARIRISGQRDWKKVWMVVQEGSGDPASDQDTAAATNGNAAAHPTVFRKRRVSNIFSSSSPTTPNASSVSLPSKAFVSIYNSPKPKDKKKALLTITNVFQVFAVYPERPELISKSSLMKIEGFLEDGDMAGKWKGREGWAFLMPEGENGSEKQPQAGAAGQGGGLVAEMLKWIVALHDAFKLYGRPEAWTWDPRNPVSLMYGYPVGTMKEVCCPIF